GEPFGERFGVEDLLHVQSGERDLGGPRQIEAVLGDFVDVRLLGGKEAGPVHGALADEDRRADEREAAVDESRDRQAEDRLFDEGRLADDVAEPRARDTRRALHLEAAELEVVARAREPGRLAPAANLDRVVLRLAVRNALVRRVREPRQRRLALGLRSRQLLLRPAEILLDLLQLLDLLRRRLALNLLA